MDWKPYFEEGLEYGAFLERYGNEGQRERWRAMNERVQLTDEQRALLSGFAREMPVLCMAGAWCGDCVHQVPILHKIAEACPKVDLRIIDRDAFPEVREELAVNGGQRVPVVVFLSEDFYECQRYGDRALAFYRQMAADQLGPACPLGVVPPADDLLLEATDDWLREFERVQLMLRLSSRLRAAHGD